MSVSQLFSEQKSFTGHLSNAGLLPSVKGAARTRSHFGESSSSSPWNKTRAHPFPTHKRAPGVSGTPRSQFPSTTSGNLEGLRGLLPSHPPTPRSPPQRGRSSQTSNSNISFQGNRAPARGAGAPRPKQAAPETARSPFRSLPRPNPTRRVPRLSHVRRRGPKAPTPPAPLRAQCWVREKAGAPNTVAAGQAPPARPAPRPRASLPLGRGRGLARPRPFPHRVCYLV